MADKKNSEVRYQIHVPTRHREGHPMPLLLDSVRNALTQAGLHGRHVHRNVEADLGHNKPEMYDIITVDGHDHETTENAIKAATAGLKALSGQPAIYVSKLPITSFLF